MKTPFSLPEGSIIEALSVGVGLRLIVDPSMPTALGLLALAGAWALEKIFVSHARVYRNSSIDAQEAAERAAASASEAASALVALEGRLVRLETREGWRVDGQVRR
jgi:energy-converting hydrogenase Eha subunit B